MGTRATQAVEMVGEGCGVTESDAAAPQHERGCVLVGTKWRTDGNRRLWPGLGWQILLAGNPASVPICVSARSQVPGTAATSVAVTTLTSAFTLSN